MLLIYSCILLAWSPSFFGKLNFAKFSGVFCIGKGSESGLNVVFDFSQFIFPNSENSLCLPLKINPFNLEILNQAENIT